MKKIISLVILLALALTLTVSCSKKAEPFTGVYTAGDTTYVIFKDGAAGAVMCTAGSTTAVDVSFTADGVTLGDKSFAKSELTKTDTTAIPAGNTVTAGNTVINGVTDASASAAIIPESANSISAGAFANSGVKVIVITAGDKITLDNGCLKNGGSLAVVISADADPNDVTVAKGLLDGTDNVTFYIEKAALATYKSHYNWSQFKDLMVGF